MSGKLVILNSSVHPQGVDVCVIQLVNLVEIANKRNFPPVM